MDLIDLLMAVGTIAAAFGFAAGVVFGQFKE